MEQPPVRIFLRPIGSPLTIGMSGLVIASLVQSGLDLRWISTSETAKVGLILVTAPLVLQLLASVFSYLARDGAAGAALGVMAVSWAALGVVHVVSVPGSRSGAIGLMLLAAGGVLALSAVAVSLAKPLPALVFMIGAARFALAGIYELSGTRFWVDIAGIAGLVVIGLAAYCVLAFELEGQRDEALLPTLRRGEPGAAFTHAVPAQLDGLPQEAGIRQTT